MMNGIIRDLLFIDNPSIAFIAKDTNKLALSLVPLFIYLGAIGEFFTNWDYKGLMARVLQSLLAILVLFSLIRPTVEWSLDYSEYLIKSKIKNSNFLHHYIKKTPSSHSSSKVSWDWKILEKITNVGNVLGARILFAVGYVIFLLLKLIYSMVYYINLNFFGLICCLSILSITKSALLGLVRTWIWLILMPIVVAYILIILGGGEYFFTATTGKGLIGNAESLLQFICFGLALLLSPLITEKLISLTGISSVGSSIGQIAAMPFVMKGVNAFNNYAIQSVPKLGARGLMSGARSYYDNKRLKDNFQQLMGQKALYSNQAGNFNKIMDSSTSSNSLNANKSNNSNISNNSNSSNSSSNRNSNSDSSNNNKSENSKVKGYTGSDFSSKIHNNNLENKKVKANQNNDGNREASHADKSDDIKSKEMNTSTLMSKQIMENGGSKGVKGVESVQGKVSGTSYGGANGAVNFGQSDNYHLGKNLNNSKIGRHTSPLFSSKQGLNSSGNKFLPAKPSSIKEYKEGRRLIGKINNRADSGRWNKLNEGDLVKMAVTHNNALKHHQLLDKNWNKGVLHRIERSQLRQRLQEKGYSLKKNNNNLEI